MSKPIPLEEDFPVGLGTPMLTTPGRRCLVCGNRLNQYNRGDTCLHHEWDEMNAIPLQDATQKDRPEDREHFTNRLIQPQGPISQATARRAKDKKVRKKKTSSNKKKREEADS